MGNNARRGLAVVGCAAMLALLTACPPDPGGPGTTTTTTTTTVPDPCGRPGHAFGVVDASTEIVEVFGGGQILYDIVVKLTLFWDDGMGNVTAMAPSDPCLGEWSRVIAESPDETATLGYPLDPFAPDDELSKFAVLCGPVSVWLRAYPSLLDRWEPSAWVEVPIPCADPV